MKLSEVFRHAKCELWKGHGEQYQPRFICHAINRLFCRHPLHDDSIYEAKRVIAQLLDGHITLDDWLIAKGHAKPHEIITKRGRDERLQATRHAWLDHLIQHYESIGQ